MTEVSAVYLGSGRTRLSIGDRSCIMDNHLDSTRQMTALCPTEMLAAAVAG